MFDMKHLTRLKKLDENAPETMKAFWAFDKAVFEEGALSAQTKQIIAVAVAAGTDSSPNVRRTVMFFSSPPNP